MPSLPGKSRNYPIFKFGQISNIAAEDVETHCAPASPAFSASIWLIAANLVPGNSGSPIFHVPLGIGSHPGWHSPDVTRRAIVLLRRCGCRRYDPDRLCV
jgi:hypothetical protein